MRVVLAPVLALAVAATGCALISGLDGIGVCQGTCDGGPASDGGTGDATADTGADSGGQDGGSSGCTSAPGTCVDSIPQGWTLVTTSASCPAGFTSGTAYVSNPSASDGTCGCGSCNIQSSTCPQSVQWESGVNGQCGDANGSAPANQCTDITGPYLNVHSVQGTGQCTVTPTGAPGAVQSTPVPTCAPSQMCQEDLCRGKLGVPACVTRSGAAQCPQGFSKRQVVGTSASASCDCSCQVNASCLVTGSLYTQSGCLGGTVAPLSANNSCTSRGATTLSIQPTIAKGATTCTPTSNGATVTLAGEATLCCK